MHIGIDISQAVYQGTGVARFTEQLVRTILSNPENHTWTFFCYHFRRNLSPSLQQEIKQNRQNIVSVFAPPRVMSVCWNDLHILPIDMLIPGLDWFITSDWTEPPAHCKKATIVHDLAFRRYPETIDPLIMKVFQKKLDLVKKETQVIFADSEATKHDLIKFYNIPSKTIIVNYPGVIVQKGHVVDLQTVKKKYSLDKPYIITVGKLEPRKNLARLFEAFSKLKNDEVELLVIGQKGWGTMPAPVPGIRLLGFVPDEDLAALYKHSLGLIFPSLWEGFGYPAVEAMSYGIPTALSNRGSLAEIGKDTAILFDPEQTDSIMAALTNLINNAPLRADLVKKGPPKAATFTWQRYLQQLITTLEQQ